MDLKQRLRCWGRFDTRTLLSYGVVVQLRIANYMPNGSLHSRKSCLLDWPMRYKIAMDAAEGLSYYLHHDCAPPRDVKVLWLHCSRTENSISHLSYPSLLPLTENAVLWRIPFSYLKDIQMRFMKNYGKVAYYAPAYSMYDEFSRVLHQQMEFFSSSSISGGPLLSLRHQIHIPDGSFLFAECALEFLMRNAIP
ncbi:hypothetical protein RDI58_000839 [Solanum bulbocastanum]|uniref:Longin domain-containing protein n=1 Tax=Solanum bulbocastanum TaxID=147425 RepID=A0AAN8YPF0_SOLBU